MTSATRGRLTITVPALEPGQDPRSGISFTRLSLLPALGVTITSMVDDATGASATVADRTARIAFDAKQGTQPVRRTFTLQFDNHGGVTSFMNHLKAEYYLGDSPGDTMVHEEEIQATTPAAAGGDIVARDSSNTMRNVRTYALYFRNANRVGRSLSNIRLSVSGDQEILAAGPFPDRQSVVVRSRDSARVGGVGEPAATEVSLPPGALLKPIYLTVAGGTGRAVTIHWTTYDGATIVTEDSVTITDPITAVRVDERGDPTGAARLYTPVPNPSSLTTTFQLHLDQATSIDVVVTDQRGNVVDRVVSSELFEAGDHVIVLSTEEFVSGTYYLTLRSALGTDTRAFQVVR